MSLIKALRAQLGMSGTATQNFTLTAEAADGSMKLARGNAGATSQDILTVDADGRMAHGVAMSCIRLNTANGYGSTNTMIRRFTNTVLNQGNDITYADSATLGASFTINKSGVYSFSFSDVFNGGQNLGLSLNTATPTTAIQSCAAGEILAVGFTQGANAQMAVSWCGYLSAGAVVRAHTSGAASGTPTSSCQITAARVS